MGCSFIIIVLIGRSELEATLAGGVGQGRDAAVVLVPRAVEHDVLHTGRLRALRDETPDLLGLRRQ